MSFPTNCVMCTLGHFLGTDSYGAADQSGGMDGPPYDEAGVSSLLVQCGLSQFGTYHTFGSLHDATRHMRQYPGEYAVGMHGVGLGHMIAADSSSGMVEFTDAQSHTTTAPLGAGACSIWRVDPAMGRLVGGLSKLRI